jgi:shikimate kinase
MDYCSSLAFWLFGFYLRNMECAVRIGRLDISDNNALPILVYLGIRRSNIVVLVPEQERRHTTEVTCDGLNSAENPLFRSTNGMR